MLLTQEEKFYLQKASPSNIECARDTIMQVKTNHLIEEQFKRDLLVRICGSKESEYNEAVEESGVFYFFNEYGNSTERG